MERWRGWRRHEERPRKRARPCMRCRCSVYLANAALFSFPPLGNQAAQARPVVLDDLLAAIGELFLHVVGEEEAHIQAHDGAEPNELVRPHLALAVEDVPQALAVDGCATRELGDTDAARVPRLLHPYDDQLRVIHPLNRLPSVRLFCVPESSTTPD